MIKSNSKQARDAVRAYIIDNFDPCGYAFSGDPEHLPTVAAFILNTFEDEMRYSRVKNNQERFTNWCAGLPSVIDASYYYNVSAVDLLGEWLQETESEKARYTEEKAESYITYLIYSELTKAATKA